MKKIRAKFENNSRQWFALWLVFCGITALVISFWPQWKYVRARHTNKTLVREMGYVGYACYDTLSILKSWYDEKRVSFANVEPFNAFLDNVRQSRELGTSPSADKHVIYLQLESVDGPSVSAKHNGEPVMPFLRELAKDATYFPNNVDNSSSGRTTDGEFLALCSLPPVARKPVYNNYALDKIPSLPRSLNEAGYYTFSIHGNGGAFWNRANAHRQLGYQDSYFENVLDRSDRIGWGISDESILQQAALKIANAKSKTFAHIILLTNHHPYHHVGRKFGYEKGDLVEDHIDSLRYVDNSIRLFFEILENYGLLEESIIAIYSDHDSAIEALLRKGYQPERAPLLNDTVPLIIYGLDREPQVFEKVTGLQDLPVIILEALGLKIPATFSGNTIQSDAPTLTPSSQLISAEGGELNVSKAPFSATKLTKLAILHPEKFEPSSN